MAEQLNTPTSPDSNRLINEMERDKGFDSRDGQRVPVGGCVLYQLYYREEQKKEMYHFTIPHLNEKLTIFFENTPIVKLVTETKATKIGVTSWKLRQKFKFSFFRQQDFTEERIKREYDVLSLTKNTKDHRMLRAADTWHPGFMDTMAKIWAKLGLRMPTEVRQPINHNYFIAKTEIYQDYVENLLKPVMELMINDNEIIPLAMADSNYTTLERGANLDNLQKDLGLNYYPMAPFLCERLFPMYCEMKRIKVNYLI